MNGWGTQTTLSAGVLAAGLGLPSPTADQERVIEAPPVPTLVVAGAGSGKTETMSSRVVWLVANGHVPREQILGLTFTRKAAGELAERMARRLSMLDEIGRRGLLPILPEVAGEFAFLPGIRDAAAREHARRQLLDQLAERHGTAEPGGQGRVFAPRAEDLLLRPVVSTYNAFADGVVREHAARIGRDPEAAMLSQAASWVLAREVVMRADLPGLEEVEPGLNSVVDAVQRLAGDALDHRADLDLVDRIAREQGEAFAPGRSHTDIDKAASNLLALPLLTALVREYLAEKERRGVLDFADQVSGAWDIIETAPDVREQLREQHRVVLLDEYQDTSVIQTRFLAALFRDSPVMAVGDPHQSIYGWRGASADNLPLFGRDFSSEPPRSPARLMVSFRNGETILDVANRVLAPLQESADVGRLEAFVNNGAGEVTVLFPATVDEEAAEVAEWFARRRRAATAGAEPATGAILFRTKTHMRAFAAALAARGVPHRILGLGGLLSEPEVVDVVSALRVMNDAGAGSALIRLLTGPRFSIGVADLAALHDLAVALSRRDAALQPLDPRLLQRLRDSAGQDERVSIVDALEFVRAAPEGYRMLEGITPEGRRRLREAGEMFARLRRSAGQPIPELIGQIESELRLDIELAANERRGPARSAQAQLRTFVEEVRAFLAVDERGTLGSLLAWLEKAESSDELMPRVEPPEPGVVQLLTIHGAKGLEWDAVAVARMVEGELPSGAKDTAGWFGFGVLPFAARGDRAALPSFAWTPPAPGEDPQKAQKAFIASLTSKSAKTPGALHVFKEEYREHQVREERRLAYVAITRAKHALLLSGSRWSGRATPHKPSRFLADAAEALGIEPPQSAEGEANPYEGVEQTLSWPMDPLGARRPAVENAVEIVRQAQRSPAEPSPELAALLEERERRRRVIPAAAPTRIPASRFKDYVIDFGGTVRAIARPMPERPFPQTALGTLFHAWVEGRYGAAGSALSLDDALWESDEEELSTAPATAADRTQLARLQEIFERSEWAALAPLEVESEINFALPGDEGEPDHLVICKLDAVFEREGRIEIVDWKTGRPPKTAEETEERMLQLALYRLAYHRRHGIPLEKIDVALFYVAEDLVIRGDRLYSEEELVQRWSAARAAR